MPQQALRDMESHPLTKEQTVVFSSVIAALGVLIADTWRKFLLRVAVAACNLFGHVYHGLPSRKQIATKSR